MHRLGPRDVQPVGLRLVDSPRVPRAVAASCGRVLAVQVPAEAQVLFRQRRFQSDEATLWIGRQMERLIALWALTSAKGFEDPTDRDSQLLTRLNASM